MYKKAGLTVYILLFIGLSPVLANDNAAIKNTVIGNGIGIGSALAIVICWSRTNSVLVSALAGIFGWFYIIYYVIFIRNKH